MDRSVLQSRTLHGGVFDEEEREHIRGALNKYRVDRKIGVPTLRQHISIATGRTRNDPRGNDPFLIDQKTLQRFLKGSHRTNDSFLVPLAQFVSSIPAPPAADRLGSALSTFFGPSSSSAASRELSDPVQLAGAYEIFGPRTLFPDPSDGLGAARWRGRAPSSGTAIFLTQPGKLYLNIREREFIDGAASTGQQGERSTFDGTLIQFDRVIFAVLRDQYSHLPRTYYLRQSEDGALAGTVIECAVRRDLQSYYSYASSDDYLFRKIGDVS